LRHLHLKADHYSALERDPAWRWPHFTPYEMRCQGTEKVKVGFVFMDRLQAIRKAYGRPLSVFSGYRSPEWNLAVTKRKSRTGAHTHGRAVDLWPAGGVEDVPLILNLAWTHGMTRCGLMLSRPEQRFHLDDMTASEGFAVREDSRGLFCWTYP